MERRTALGLGLLFALETPLGTLAGLALPFEEGAASSALVATAGGSFTVGAWREVLPREFGSGGGGRASKEKRGALLLGFGSMALLGLWL